LLKEYCAKKGAKKRKAKSFGGNDTKKSKKDSKDLKDSEGPDNEVAALMCLAIDSEISGGITQSPTDRALST
jgi:hypothetical protein